MDSVQALMAAIRKYDAILLAYFMTACVCHAQIEIIESEAGALDSRLAFSSPVNGRWQIFIHDFKTSATTQLTEGGLDKRQPCWMNDSEVLFRDTGGKLFSVNVREKKEAEFDAGQSGRIVSPEVNSRLGLLAYARFQESPVDNTDIYLFEIRSRKSRRITASPDLDLSPAISPDGKSIAYVGGRGPMRHLLRIVDVESGKARILQDREADDASPSWTTDGRWIVYSSNASGWHEIWRVSPDGTQREQLTHHKSLSADPAPTSVNRGIVYVLVSEEGSKLHYYSFAQRVSVIVAPLASKELRDPSWLSVSTTPGTNAESEK